MHRNFIRCLLFAATVDAMPLLAAAPAPTDPGATVPGVEYQSVFSDYRPYADETVSDWRSINEEVARVGGHAGVVRGASGHANPAQVKPAQPTAEAPAAQAHPPVRGAPKAAAEHGHSVKH